MTTRPADAKARACGPWAAAQTPTDQGVTAW
jgi:hypothetical protein